MKAEVMKCQKCGDKMLKSKATYCSHCGKPTCRHCLCSYEYCTEWTDHWGETFYPTSTGYRCGNCEREAEDKEQARLREERLAEQARLKAIEDEASAKEQVILKKIGISREELSYLIKRNKHQ
jgi:hypothetical protein